MKDLLKSLKKINLPVDQFVIFASGPLGVRNIRESHDLDIVVLPGLWTKLLEEYPVEEFEFGQKIRLAEGIEAYDKIGFGYRTKDVIQTADTINGFRFANLKIIMEWKRKMGREKDLKDIRLIEEYLKKNGDK